MQACAIVFLIGHGAKKTKLLGLVVTAVTLPAPWKSRMMVVLGSFRDTSNQPKAKRQ